MTDTASGPCPHVDFDVIATIHRLVTEEPTDGRITPATGYQADLKVSCSDCAEPFVWKGPMPIGLSPGEPRVSVDGTELRAPLRPRSAAPDFGSSLPGFGVRFRGSGA